MQKMSGKKYLRNQGGHCCALLFVPTYLICTQSDAGVAPSVSPNRGTVRAPPVAISCPQRFHGNRMTDMCRVSVCALHRCCTMWMWGWGRNPEGSHPRCPDSRDRGVEGPPQFLSLPDATRTHPELQPL